MPLNISLDASYFDGERIVLSGQAGKYGIDAALFLTALRAACEDEEPYFSLDPDDGSLWNRQGEEAFSLLWKRVEPELTSAVNGTKTRPGSNLAVRTISARRDYSAQWQEIAPRFPNLRSKLVFNPEWLRQTRFGKILYDADVLLKELLSGVSVSGGKLRAVQVDGYLAADAERAAKSLLMSRDEQQATMQWRGSRLWFDLTQVPSAPLKAKVETVSAGSNPRLSDLLTAHGLIRTTRYDNGTTISAMQDNDVVDLSLLTPRMFVRRHDNATGKDLADNDPDLDGLASDVTQRFNRYADAYDELQALREIFRAYIAAVNIIDSDDRLCERLNKLALFDAEKVAEPLPAYHPSELFITIVEYSNRSTTSREVRSAVAKSINGGVSISGRRFSEAEMRSGPTAITRAVSNTISKGTFDPDESGRVYVVLTLTDELAIGRKVASTNGSAPSGYRKHYIENEPPAEPLPAQPLPSLATSPSVGVTLLSVLVVFGLVIFLFNRPYRQGKRS